MLDIELLRSFVSVVDAGGFTRAGERVHRTQSTVSQQIKRLEESVGRPLLVRDGKRATPTEEGERLLSYARRILALEQEARDVVARPMADGVVRLGLPEDFAAYRLVELLSDFVRGRPTLRLDVRSGLSATNRAALERGELDVALLKRKAGSGAPPRRRRSSAEVSDAGMVTSGRRCPAGRRGPHQTTGACRGAAAIPAGRWRPPACRPAASP